MKETPLRPSARPPAAAQEAMQKVLDRLRWRIQCSPLTQRTLERQLSFSKGYLSQVLRGHVDLKINHLLALLEALEVGPRDFFVELGEEPLDARGGGDARPCETAETAGRPRAEEGADQALFFAELQSLDEIRRRLARCEQALLARSPRGG